MSRFSCQRAALFCLLLGLHAMFVALPAPAADEVVSPPAPAAKPAVSVADPSTPLPAAAAAPAVENTEAARLIQQVQEEWKTARAALEATRRAAESASLRQAERFDLHVAQMERRLETQQREKEEWMRLLESSNRQNFRYGALLLGLGLALVLVLTSLQWRAMARLTALVARQASSLPPSPATPLSTSASPLPIPAGRETLRLIESLERLEKRILGFERAAQPVIGTPAPVSGVSEPAEAPVSPAPKPVVLPPAPGVPSTFTETQQSQPATATGDGAKSESFVQSGPSRTARSVVGGILGKGEALLQLGQPGEALSNFDEALRLEPAMVEAWVKKGSALERLERMEEALNCYDRAIQLDRSFTLAYLYKGGVCNRLERFDEALACYEEALRSHEAAAAS